ncbi:MAG: glycosyltransferase family 4 protein [Chloroflexi bacterium]|nr:glycosyltransferase family 4 protein [Chloroflexota bacterium]
MATDRGCMLQVCAVDFTAFHLLRPLLLAARDDGWRVAFACADGPWARALRDEGFPHRRVRMSRTPSPAAQLSATAQLAAELRRLAPDIVHTHTPVGGMVGRLAAMTWRGPVVHTFHGLPFEVGDRSFTGVAFLAVERLLARRTTRFFSQAQGDVARAVTLGIARERDTIVIGNGIDVARFHPDLATREAVRRASGIPSNATVVLTTARIVREKGLIELADAALALRDQRDLYFVIAGSALPSDRTAVEVELDAHPVKAALRARWRRLGHRTDLAQLLQAADVFALPTYREGLPRSVIEAMASGLPIVATEIPACRELVREGETGLLVPPRDVVRLAHALSALATNRGLRETMGSRARQIAVENYDERLVLERQLAIFRGLVPK